MGNCCKPKSKPHFAESQHFFIACSDPVLSSKLPYSAGQTASAVLVQLKLEPEQYELHTAEGVVENVALSLKELEIQPNSTLTLVKVEPVESLDVSLEEIAEEESTTKMIDSVKPKQVCKDLIVKDAAAASVLWETAASTHNNRHHARHNASDLSSVTVNTVDASLNERTLPRNFVFPHGFNAAEDSDDSYLPDRDQSRVSVYMIRDLNGPFSVL